MAVVRWARLSRRRRRRAGLAALLAMAATMAVAAPALAGSDGYTCGPIPPGVFCQWRYPHHSFENVADYPGVGTVYVCSQAIRDSGGSIYADGCAYNHVVIGYSSSVLTRTQVQNASPYTHTVNGRVYF
jgi:hypothetical protein